MKHSDKRKKFYGSITVSERGQIVIPAEARKDFSIEVGEKLLVLGDLDKGIVITKATAIMRMIDGSLKAAKQMGDFLHGSTEQQDTEE
ncbi:MAG: AbrB/MazE/SpoVT family DNA-binding domain-containing protein [Dehalococcoidia bacterium]|nr:AbrB/MazE/SpoVT family DNA-binding domain-containing protein [Dehalococcoidia bacterium]